MSQSQWTSLAKEHEQAVEPITFTQVDKEPVFKAEFAVIGEDLVIHFFPPDRSSPRYWETIFPAVLDPVAKHSFKADAPRLRAMRITDFDIDSWWFRAYGFANVLNPSALAYRFFDALAVALDAKKDR